MTLLETKKKSFFCKSSVFRHFHDHTVGDMAGTAHERLSNIGVFRPTQLGDGRYDVAFAPANEGAPTSPALSALAALFLVGAGVTLAMLLFGDEGGEAASRERRRAAFRKTSTYRRRS
jgi:hypothetical protein